MLYDVQSAFLPCLTAKIAVLKVILGIPMALNAANLEVVMVLHLSVCGV